MASVTARLSVLGENGYGEPEQDANSALTELDKGLRSGKIGEQCEAIVRFPRIFAKYPFPILINSAFLKLADVFRMGNNFLRLCVLKVTQQSEKHLDKILNVDEFVRRIYAVIHSNDPLARALTLRTLGSIACIIPDRKNVHHTIRNSLDTHDGVELEAAIFATEKFASYSKTFASNLCSKISQMIEGLATPVDMKLRLIPIFQHMHHDAQTAATVRKLCTDLLPSYPVQKFVLVTLNTLTQLSAAATIDIPDQVTLLLQYLNTDPRHSVKTLVLKNLKFLAEKGAHMWSKDDILVICIFALKTPYKELKYLSLGVLVALAKTVAVEKFDIRSGSTFLILCEESCYNNDVTVAAKAVELLTQVALYSYQEGHVEGDFDIFQEAVMAVESLLLLITSSVNISSSVTALKIGLLCAVSLCEADSNISHQFVDSIGSLVASTSGQTTVLLCETLAAMANRKTGILNSLTNVLLATLRERARQSEHDKQLVVILCTLIFQAAKDRSSLTTEIEVVASLTTKITDLWVCYKIARQAARYGHHAMAGRVFSNLTNCVCSEHLHFWLVGLEDLCCGESKLSSTSSLMAGNSEAVMHIDRLTEAVTYYIRGISALRAATTPTHTLQFQCEYARLRSEMLQAHAQLVNACNCFKMSPPPAISAALAAATRDELNRCGRIATQLRKSIKEFRTVGEMYGKLYQSYFDMDPLTLTNILVLQQSCFLMSHVVENITLKSQNIGFMGSDEERTFDVTLELPKQHFLQSIEIQGMVNASRRAFALAQEVSLQKDLKLISHEHIEVILEISKILTEVPLCYPRFFFQSLQSTNIKLAISPQPRASGEPIHVQNNSHLALKVEGIVQHASRSSQFRRVKSVVITVSSQPQIRQQSNPDTKSNHDNATNNMIQTVEPHNDYFNAQFLLAFPVAGVHHIVVEVAVLDENGDMWKTGPRYVMSAKLFDDSGSQKSSSNVAAAGRSNFSSRY